MNGLQKDGRGGFVYIEGMFMRLCAWCMCSNIANYDQKNDEVYCARCWKSRQEVKKQ